MSQSLSSLLKATNLKFGVELIDRKIYAICTNSKKITPGSLFIGLPGTNVSGDSFCYSALDSGAITALGRKIAVISDLPLVANTLTNADKQIAHWTSLLATNFWQQPSRWMILLGVTGTNGKTTVTHLIEHLSTASGRPSALFGTLANRWPGYSATTKNTTPFADQLQAQLALAVEAGSQIGAMEVSSHALNQYRVMGCQFAGAVFTNLSQDHLDYHPSLEAYFESKASLFEHPLLANHGPLAVINSDDLWGARLAQRLGSNCWRSSLRDFSAELTMRNLTFSVNGVSGIIVTPLGEGYFSSPMVGYFNLMNLLQAIGVLIQQKGFSLSSLLKAVKTFRGIPGRMERLIPYPNKLDLSPSVIIDYAHTPDGLEKALIAARSFVKGSLICVFGCGGNRDKRKRPIMGETAARLADEIIVTSDNPRTENPEEIIKDILAGIPLGRKVLVEVDRSIAIMSSVSAASPNDLILIVGKGHEDYQIFRDDSVYFEDREEAEKSLRARLYKTWPLM
uniref:UDP-N-acetylmuramoylalanyl-D-glutamate--2,6-diaminopimelate ligase n=1 Tax=Paulinella chromatophora TaxID=39717 RepID=B1X5C2_PAUCH|nr:UDP-N-acetylmuramoylalanyl-D-glutamate--2,6- diaminopimelate ligase [Paulinella chromatophora]ACB43141.1 UDP-N-acetylmuramoylalanyl-D-glutamate--2,6- diaminopimelate ligase [Paulinella chromatophora]